MNWFDIIVFLILFWYLVIDARKGFVKIIFDFGALAGAILLAFVFFQTASQALVNALRLPDYLAQIFSFTFIFLGTYFIFKIAGGIFSDLIKVTPFKKIDWLLGAVLGIFKGTLIIGLIFLILIVFSFFSILPGNIESGLKDSFSYSQSRYFFNQVFVSLNNFLLDQTKNPNIFNQFTILSLSKKQNLVEEKIKLGNDPLREVEKFIKK